MNKQILILITAIFLVGTVNAAEYWEFTNQDDKTIVARILEYDANAGKVQLELKNRKKAWVDLSTLF